MSQVIPLDAPRKVYTLFRWVVEVAKPDRRPLTSASCNQTQHTHNKHDGKQRLRKLNLVFSQDVNGDLQHKGHQNAHEGYKEVDAHSEGRVQPPTVADDEARKENLNVRKCYVRDGNP